MQNETAKVEVPVPIAAQLPIAIHVKERLLATVSFLARVLASVPFWWGACLVSAAILALSARHTMNPDGLSYLDLASEAVHSGPSQLLSGYWSPGYPALLSIAIALFRPSPGQEFPLVHFVNFILFALTLTAFHFFLRRWLSYADAFRQTSDQEKKDIVPFAFCIFLWFTLEYIGVDLVSPDLCMAAIVFLIAGITCSLSLPGAGSRHYVALGFVCGLGYYVKAAMLPLEVLFLGGLLVYPPSRFVTRRRLLLSLSIFLVTAAPLVALLSSREGRLTTGDSGRLNYAWYVNGKRLWAGWPGPVPEQSLPSSTADGTQPSTARPGDSSHAFGSLEHPPRRLMETPLVLEFGSPIKGTFPLWYDPSYWQAGLKTRFNLRQQLHALEGTLGEYKNMFHEFRQATVLISAALVLCGLAAFEKRLPNLPLREFWLLLWPLTTVLMYAVVHVEDRFLGAFCVLSCLAIYGALICRLNRRIAVAVCATVAGTLIISFTGYMSTASAFLVGDLVHPRQPDYEVVGDSLRNLGVESGDRVAVVGQEAFDPYYAHYAGLRVVANIPTADEFWKLSPAEVESVADTLRGIGVKALVAENKPEASTAANWRQVKLSGPMRVSILLLSEPIQKTP
jgi:hypothetical protein